jgi:hypothetical protein
MDELIGRRVGMDAWTGRLIETSWVNGLSRGINCSMIGKSHPYMQVLFIKSVIGF